MITHTIHDVATLEFQLIANKALLSDYALRTRQAEQMTGHLIAEAHKAWDEHRIKQFADLIAKQMDQRVTERAVQQQAILQATLIALTSALKADGEERQKMLTTMLRELTTAVQHLDKIAEKSTVAQ
jgi:hypothetical protein